MLKRRFVSSTKFSAQIINISSFILTEIKLHSTIYVLEGAKNQNSVIYSNQYYDVFFGFNASFI